MPRAASSLAVALAILYTLLCPAPCHSAAEPPPQQGTRLHFEKSLFIQSTPSGKVFAETRRVAPGENLWKILTREYQIPRSQEATFLAAFRAVNPGVDPNHLPAGQVVRVPFKVEERVSNSPAETAAEVYTVRPGDSLWRVLRSRYQVPLEEMGAALSAVSRANPDLRNPDHLLVGQQLAIPSDLAGPPAPSPETGTGVPSQADVLSLLSKLGCRVATEGETFLPLARGHTVRLDARDFPLVTGPSGRTVLLDPESRMSPALARSVEETWSYTVVQGTEARAEDQLAHLLPSLGFYEVSEGAKTIDLGRGAELKALARWTIVPRPEDLWEGTVHLIFPAGTVLDRGLVSTAKRAGFSVHVLDAAAEEDWSEDAPPRAVARLPMSNPTEGTAALLSLFGVPHRVRPAVDCDLGSGVRYRLRPELTFQHEGLEYAVTPRTPEGAESILSRAGYFTLGWPPGTAPLNQLEDLLALLGIPHARTTVEAPAGQSLRLRIDGISIQDPRVSRLLYQDSRPAGQLFLTEADLEADATGVLFRQGLLPWVLTH
jgi:hypothetical protein